MSSYSALLLCCGPKQFLLPFSFFFDICFDITIYSNVPFVVLKIQIREKWLPLSQSVPNDDGTSEPAFIPHKQDKNFPAPLKKNYVHGKGPKVRRSNER